MLFTGCTRTLKICYSSLLKRLLRNHVLDGSLDPPMVRGNFGGFPPPLDCVFPSVQRHVTLNSEWCTTSMMRFPACPRSIYKGAWIFGATMRPLVKLLWPLVTSKQQVYTNPSKYKQLFCSPQSTSPPIFHYKNPSLNFSSYSVHKQTKQNKTKQINGGQNITPFKL